MSGFNEDLSQILAMSATTWRDPPLPPPAAREHNGYRDHMNDDFVDPEGGGGFALDLGLDPGVDGSEMHHSSGGNSGYNNDMYTSSHIPDSYEYHDQYGYSEDTSANGLGISSSNRGDANGLLVGEVPYDSWNPSTHESNSYYSQHPSDALTLAGKPMFSSNTNLTPSSTVSKQPNAATIFGYPASDNLPAAEVATVSTSVVASYKWRIENFSSLSNVEKVVSPAFGTAEQPWQIVVYPRGTAGSTDGAYLSAFLRPLKTVKEAALGDEWFRSTVRFTIRVHRPSENQYIEVPESYSYTVPPSHLMILSANAAYGDGVAQTAEDPILLDDVLVQDTSVDAEFCGFDKNVPGWGFTDFMHLDEYLSSAVSATDELVVSACVESICDVESTRQSFKWCIPDFCKIVDGGLTEFSLVTVGEGAGGISSPTFGPSHALWRVRLSVNAATDPEAIAGSLEPVLTNSEATCPSWTRSISSFTIKIQGPQPEFGYSETSGDFIACKTLTGGFVFNSSRMNTGWPNLLRVSQAPECVDSYGVLKVEVEVTWTSDLIAEAAVAAEPEAAGAVPSGNHISEEEVERRIAEIQSQCDQQVSAVSAQNAELEAKVSKYEAELRSAEERDAKTALAVEELRLELSVARETESRVAEMEQKVLSTRAKVAALRASMDNDAHNAVETDASVTDVGSEAGSRTYSKTEQSNQFYSLKARCLILESELASAKENIRLQKIQKNDCRLLADAGRAMSPGMSGPSSVMNDSSDGPISISEAMANAQDEIESAQQVLTDFNNRKYSWEIGEQAVEKAAARADIAMVYAELSLSLATLLDSCLHYDQASLPTANPNSNVSLLTYELERALSDFEVTLTWLKPTYSQDGFSSPTFYENQVPPNPLDQYENGQLPVQQQEYINSLTTRLHELEVSAEREKIRADMAISELESHRRIEEIKAKAIEMGSPAIVGSPMRPMPQMSIRGSVVGSNLLRGRGDFYPEPWTPVGADPGPVSAADLTKILEKLQTKQSTSSTFAMIFVGLLASFVAYSTLHIHCADPQSSDSALCTTVVPIYTSASTVWHKAAEQFMWEVLPRTQTTITGVTQQTRSMLERARQERIARQKVQQDQQQQLQRLEDEHRERVRQLEEAAIAAADKQARDAATQMQRIADLEREKAAEIQRREAELAAELRRIETDNLLRIEEEVKRERQRLETEMRLQSEQQAKAAFEEWVLAEKSRMADALKEQMKLVDVAIEGASAPSIIVDNDAETVESREASLETESEPTKSNAEDETGGSYYLSLKLTDFALVTSDSNTALLDNSSVVAEQTEALPDMEENIQLPAQEETEQSNIVLPEYSQATVADTSDEETIVSYSATSQGTFTTTDTPTSSGTHSPTRSSIDYDAPTTMASESSSVTIEPTAPIEVIAESETGVSGVTGTAVFDLKTTTTETVTTAVSTAVSSHAPQDEISGTGMQAASTALARVESEADGESTSVVGGGGGVVGGAGTEGDVDGDNAGRGASVGGEGDDERSGRWDHVSE
ncbi:hypothetical protein HDU84_003836 [Entophlyctis sp. JEL0112]|nr:hypothetical protein HDU84_003836 [Entophlyctis sp. JEL0112]